MSPSILFFLKTVLLSLDSLHLHINFRINMSISAKNACWDSDGDCTGSTVHFEENRYLTSTESFRL